MQLTYPIAYPTPSEIESGAELFRRQTGFVKGVVAMAGLPNDDRAEICFAGRSNVGKSSLINAITNRKSLARASNTPGRTQEINYFEIGESGPYLVDLPGYGFANAPIAVVEKWQQLMRAYLSGRASLRRAFLLVDSRHGVKKIDDEIMSLLDNSAVTFQVVLTKFDKLKPGQEKAVLDQTRHALNKHTAAYPELLTTSASKGTGIEALRAVIAMALK